ncbi:MAG: hypothetical protein ABIJ00_12735 [Candidatus Eisenbacteria bacterium]
MKSRTVFATSRCGMMFILLSTVALMFSCTDNNCVTVCDECEETGPLRLTPDSLLNFLAEAYEGKDIDAYSEALHEYYEFEFTDDIADSLGLPPERSWWAKEMDVASTGNMFDHVNVNDVEFHLAEFGVGLDWQDCSHEFISGDPPETTLIQGICQVFEPDIKVYIEEPGQEERILWVHGSLLAIMVTPDPNSEGEWVVLRIVETKKNPLVSAPEPSTWGGIKGMFK